MLETCWRVVRSRFDAQYFMLHVRVCERLFRTCYRLAQIFFEDMQDMFYARVRRIFDTWLRHIRGLSYKMSVTELYLPFICLTVTSSLTNRGCIPNCITFGKTWVSARYFYRFLHAWWNVLQVLGHVRNLFETCNKCLESL